MDVLMFFGGFITLIYVFIKISDLLERRQDRRIAKELGPELERLLQKVDIYDTEQMRKDLEGLRVGLQSNLATLKERTEEPLNICPKCGDTLNVKYTSYYGRIIGCPNYPDCRFFLKISDIDFSSLESLRVE